MHPTPTLHSTSNNNNDNQQQPLIRNNNKLNHGVIQQESTGRKWSGKASNTVVVGGKKDIGFGSTPIHRLPTEILAHIFAQLSPSGLGLASLVNRAWRDVIADEASWRSAFENYFKILDDGLALGRRLDNTRWRSEYMNRVSLLTRWSKSRTATVIHDPLKSSPITAIHITFPPVNLSTRTKAVPFGTTSNHPSSSHLSTPRSTSSPSPRPSPQNNSTSQPHPTLLSVSLSNGLATKSDPYTGKVSKSILEANPLDNVRQLLLPLVVTTSFSISPDGSKLVYGCTDGNFRIINTNLTNPSAQSGQAGLNARAWFGIGQDAINNGVRSLLGHVGGEVHELSFSTLGNKKDLVSRNDVFVSVGGLDGVGIWLLGDNVREVPGRKIWSSGKISSSENSGGAREIRNGSATLSSTINLPIVKATAIAFDSGWNGKYSRSSSVVVGMEDGSVHIWTGVSLEGSNLSRDRIEENYLRILDGKSNDCGAIDKLILDQIPGSQNFSLLVHQKEGKEFYKYDLSSNLSGGSLIVSNKITFGHKEDYIGIITAFAVDFDEPPPLSSANGIITGIIIPPDDLPPLATSSTLPTSTSQQSFESNSSNNNDGEDNTETFFPPSSNSNELHGSNAFGRKKFVVAGDNQGRVFVWDWETATTRTGEVVLPRRMIQGFETRVTSLEITTAVILVGGLDGTIRVYDPLTSTLLRAFKDRSASRLPSRMLAAGLLDSAEEERWQVSMIRADSSGLVAAVGGRILAWRISEELFAKKRGSGRTVSGKMSARGERVQSEYEFRQEVKESLNSISGDSNDRISRVTNERRVAVEFGIPQSLDNMTEEEAVALALMMSVEDEEERMMNDLDLDNFSLGDAETSAYQSFGSASRRSSIHSNNNLEYSDDDRSYTGSQSHSFPNSPYLSASQSNSISQSPSHRDWIPRSPNLTPYEPHSYSSNHSHQKLQLSPRLGPTYGSYPTIQNAIPDMSEELFPTLSTNASPTPSTSRSFSSQSALPRLSNPITPSTPPVRRGWSEVARTPVSGSGSPISRSGTTSMLTTRLREYGNTVETREITNEEREAEELRFAIEMSMAEEASRNEF